MLRRAPCVLAALLVITGLTAPAAGQVMVEGAGVQPPPRPFVREAVTWWQTARVKHLRLESRYVAAPTKDVELSAMFPLLLFREAGSPGALDEGYFLPGDLTLQAKFRLLQDDDVRASWRLAAYVTASLPTGLSDREVAGSKLAPSLQPGLGTGGVGAGAGLTRIDDRWRVTLDLRGAWFVPVSGFRPSPLLQTSGSLSFRIVPEVFSSRSRDIEIRALVELLGTHRFGGSEQGMPTGSGYELWLGPSLQIYPTYDVLFELAAQFAVVQPPADAAGDRRWLGSFAIKVLF